MPTETADPVQTAGVTVNPRLAGFLRERCLPTPIPALGVEAVLRQYQDLRRALPDALIYYAIKANLLPGIVAALPGAPKQTEAGGVKVTLLGRTVERRDVASSSVHILQPAEPGAL